MEGNIEGFEIIPLSPFNHPFFSSLQCQIARFWEIAFFFLILRNKRMIVVIFRDISRVVGVRYQEKLEAIIQHVISLHSFGFIGFFLQ